MSLVRQSLPFVGPVAAQARATAHARVHALALARWALAAWLALPLTARSALPTVAVQADGAGVVSTYEGRVEAVRQAVLAAQVPGTVLALNAKAGDMVRAGQVLARIDARAAEQGAAASNAQVAAARAQLDVATQEVARKRQLYQKNYIAKAALDQAEGQYRAAQAQFNAQAAQAGAARAQTGFHTVTAPFDGVVASVAVVQGDMAMPGRPLMTVYDPARLRVAAAVPVSALSRGTQGARVLLGAQAQPAEPSRVQVLPTVDAASLTQELWADLPAGTGAVPGLFARVMLSGASSALAADGGKRLFVPRAAVVRRAEMTGVYVLGEGGAPLLRQVRLGPTTGDRVEVLSGVDAGEHVVIDPQAATRAAALGR